MDGLRRISGVVLVTMAVVVAVHTVVEPLYHTSTEESPYSPLWAVLGWLMFVPLVLGIAFGRLRKRDAERAATGDSLTRAVLAANVQFYGGLFFGIMFSWNWFNQLSPGFTAVGGDTVSFVWILLDAGLPLLWAEMGVHLLGAGGRESGRRTGAKARSGA